MLTPRSRELFNSIAFGSLERREANGIKLKNCQAYIREWILREQNARPNE
jgi:hypothetical protein